MPLKVLRRLAFTFGLMVSLACVPLAFAGSKKHPPAKPVDLNTATATELEQLPGVGPVTAKAILDFRAKSGPFRRVEDLLSLHGISRSKFEKLRPWVTVAPAPRLPHPPRASSAPHRELK
ncbi:MAG: helix-hairpin-helix domain-containing protein [Acidobacteriota bacterium]|nr:helix-hairpin-helix domain-containing protein [Acidobacteriota bacterium]